MSDFTEEYLRGHMSLEPLRADGAKIPREECAGGQDGKKADDTQNPVGHNQFLVIL